MSKKTIYISLLIFVLSIGGFVVFARTPPPVIKAKADGTYNLAQTYTVPGGDKENLKMTLVIKDGVIESIANNTVSSSPKSSGYQKSFETEIKKAAIGKKIESLNLSSVGGASLTTNAFNEGLSSI